MTDQAGAHTPEVSDVENESPAQTTKAAHGKGEVGLNSQGALRANGVHAQQKTESVATKKATDLIASAPAMAEELERLKTAPSFQSRVAPWMQECFGPEISADALERGDRFLEEALELLQSGGYPPERIPALVKYVYDRRQGEPSQEVGGVMVTLAAYCLAHGLDMHEAGETELARVWTKVEQIRAKQASKKGIATPLPVPPITPDGYPDIEAAPYWLVERNKGEWLHAHRVANAPEWTRDHTKAWRFSSKLGAEVQAARYPLITMGVSVTEHAEEPEPAPLKMLVDADWLRKKIAADPDMDCEVRPALSEVPPVQSAYGFHTPITVSGHTQLKDSAPAVQEQELLADVKELAEYLAGCRRSYGYVVASVLPLDKLLERILTALRTQGGE